MKTSPSFLDNTLTQMSGHKTVNGSIAKAIQSVDDDRPANRIAKAWDTQRLIRQANTITAVKSGVPVEELDWKPERMLSFVQQLMNQLGWSARKVLNSGNTTDLANGIDFSQDVAEQEANLESAHRNAVVVTYEDDFQTLLKLHTWLASKMNYLTEISDLYFYAESENVADDNEPAVYEQVVALMDFDEVMSLLDSKAEEIAELDSSKVSVEADEMDFSSAA